MDTSRKLEWAISISDSVKDSLRLKLVYEKLTAELQKLYGSNPEEGKRVFREIREMAARRVEELETKKTTKATSIAYPIAYARATSVKGAPLTALEQRQLMESVIRGASGKKYRRGGKGKTRRSSRGIQTRKRRL